MGQLRLACNLLSSAVAFRSESPLEEIFCKRKSPLARICCVELWGANILGAGFFLLAQRRSSTVGHRRGDKGLHSSFEGCKHPSEHIMNVAALSRPKSKVDILGFLIQGCLLLLLLFVSVVLLAHAAFSSSHHCQTGLVNTVTFPEMFSCRLKSRLHQLCWRWDCCFFKGCERGCRHISRRRKAHFWNLE